MVPYDDIGLDVGLRRAYEKYSAVADDFTSVSGEATWAMRFCRDDWDVRVETRTTLRSSETEFFVDSTPDGLGNDRRVVSVQDQTLPRDHLQGWRGGTGRRLPCGTGPAARGGWRGHHGPRSPCGLDRWPRLA
ncbi:hypothetical protein GCM10010381_67860 [Streptomyces xantholiticus]|nr:hypothetical protein GCM10010381_67860 [Streptomyces xantholiticus]